MTQLAVPYISQSHVAEYLASPNVITLEELP